MSTESVLFFLLAFGLPSSATIIWAGILYALDHGSAAFTVMGAVIFGLPISAAVAFASFLVLTFIFYESPDELFPNIGSMLIALYVVMPVTYWLILAYAWICVDD